MKKLFALLILLMAVSCTVTEETHQYPAIYEKPFVTGESNGVPFAFKIDDTNLYYSQYSESYISTPNENAPYSFYYGMIVYSREVSPGFSVGPSYTVSFKNMQNCYIENEPDRFYQAFDHMPTNFITEVQFLNNIKGVEVSYWSPNAISYSTLDGSQSGSSMTITGRTRSRMPGGSLKTVIVRGTFKCKLYNHTDPTDVIAITNGKFSITCQSYY